MSRSKEIFIPLHPPIVTLYVCGVTVYDYSHLGQTFPVALQSFPFSGHARAYVAFDLIYRLLCAIGYDVQYIRNFTDVDDKIINRARELQESPESLTSRFIQAFIEDMDALGCAQPTDEPRATHYISEMITMIQEILNKGHGYVVDGDVFFDALSLDGYGRLSKRALDDNRPGERISIDDRKKHPADFALWKSTKPGEVHWESPWGCGRPGWHIECSAMIRDRLGCPIDIHGGGSDLIFPHHENEIAQSQAACTNEQLIDGRDFVKYWIHNGFVNIDEEKMSKSLGNFLTIRDVLEMHQPMVLRWMLLSTQYRQPLNYSDQLMQEAATNVYYLCQTLADCYALLEWRPDAMEGMEGAQLMEGYQTSELIKGVVDGLMDDFNSSIALAAIYGHLKIMNELIHTKKGRKDKDRMGKLMRSCTEIMCCLRVMGFQLERPEDVIEEMKRLTCIRVGITEDEIQSAIHARDQARKEKEYEKADALREKLNKKGIAMCDTPQGTTWRPI